MNTVTYNKVFLPSCPAENKQTPKPVSMPCVNVTTFKVPSKYHYDKQPVRLPRSIQNLISKNRLFYSENIAARKLNL